MLRTGFFVLFAIVATASIARAQATPGGCGIWTTTGHQVIEINNNHYRLVGAGSEVKCNDVQLVADEIEIFADADRMRASGNVLFVSGTSRISADRLEFNTRTKTGTFFVASGIANIENRGVERSLFGTQEP